jgi:hypothetical protein
MLRHNRQAAVIVGILLDIVREILYVIMVVCLSRRWPRACPFFLFIFCLLTGGNKKSPVSASLAETRAMLSRCPLVSRTNSGSHWKCQHIPRDITVTTRCGIRLTAFPRTLGGPFERSCSRGASTCSPLSLGSYALVISASQLMRRIIYDLFLPVKSDFVRFSCVKAGYTACLRCLTIL